MLKRIADFFAAENLHYVEEDNCISTGFDDVIISVFPMPGRILVSAMFRHPITDLERINTWNAGHPAPTAFTKDGKLFFKHGIATDDLSDEQLGLFLATALGAIGAACKEFS